MPSPLTADQPSVRRSALLVIAGALASIAVLPYATAPHPDFLQRLPVPLPVFIVAQFAQALVLLGLLTWIGMRLARSVGMASSIALAIIGRTPTFAWATQTLGRSALAGGVTGTVILTLDKVVMPFTPGVHPGVTPDIAVWKSFLASFYGGITEELICRLFLMTLLIWLCRKLASRANSPASPWMIWVGIVGAALLFGLGHLPAVAAVWPLTTAVVARVLLLNCIGGIVFGWLYWRRGLEHAMLAHFCADLVLHVISRQAN